MLKFIKNEANEKKVLVILFLITFLINAGYIVESKMLYMTTDEMGPIAIAAYFAGHDWSSVIQNIGYYSYGYSFLLYPLYLVADSAEVFYQMAIILNALLAAAIVPISYSVGKKICSCKNQVYLYIASFLVSNFVVNIGRSASAWCETLLILLYWCIVLNFAMLEEKINYKRVIVGVCLSVYSYAVHQRTVGIVVASALFFLVLCIVKKYRMRYCLCYYGLAAVLLYFHGNIKRNIQANLWVGSIELQGNDYGGVVGRIVENISEQNFLVYFKQLWCTFSGHFFYVCVATLGFALVALILLIEKNWKTVKAVRRKEKISENTKITYWYILFSFILTLGISILFMTPKGSWDNYTRSDMLVYGRYVETVLGVLIYIGVIYFLEEKINKNHLMIIYGVTLLITVVTAYGYGKIDEQWFQKICCVGLNVFMGTGKINFWLSLFAVWIVMTLQYLERKETRRIACLGAVCIFWIGCGYRYLSNEVIPIEKYFYQYADLVETKWKTNEEAELYFCHGENVGMLSCVQFLLYDKQGMKQIEDFSEVSDEVFYGVTTDTALLLEHNEWTVLEQVNGAYLFTNEFKSQTKSIPLQNRMFYSLIDMDRSVNSGFSNNGAEGYLMYGPYISLNSGNYQVEVEYSAAEGGALLGYVDIYSETAQRVYARQYINQTEGNMAGLYLDFSLEEATSDLEIRAYTYAGSQVSIENVTIYKIDE